MVQNSCQKSHHLPKLLNWRWGGCRSSLYGFSSSLHCYHFINTNFEKRMISHYILLCIWSFEHNFVCKNNGKWKLSQNKVERGFYVPATISLKHKLYFHGKRHSSCKQIDPEVWCPNNTASNFMVHHHASYLHGMSRAH